MLKTLAATIREGQVQLSEKVELPEGTKLLVTVLSDDEGAFWLGASQTSIAAVWENTEDDIYGSLLEK